MTDKDPPYEVLKEGYIKIASQLKSLKQSLEISEGNNAKLKAGIEERDNMIAQRNKGIAEIFEMKNKLDSESKEKDARIQELSRKLEELQKQLEEAKNNTQSIQATAELGATFNKERRELLMNFEKEKHELMQKIESLTNENQDYREKITNSQGNQQNGFSLQVSNQNTNEKPYSENLQEITKTYEERIRQLNDQISEIKTAQDQKQIMAIREKENQILQLTETIESTKQKYELEMSELKSQINELKQTATIITDESTAAKIKAEELSKIIAAQSDETINLKAENDSLKARISAMSEERASQSDLTARLQQSERQKGLSESIAAELIRELSTARDEIALQRQAVSGFQKEIESMRQQLLEKDTTIIQINRQLDDEKSAKESALQKVTTLQRENELDKQSYERRMTEAESSLEATVRDSESKLNLIRSQSNRIDELQSELDDIIAQKSQLNIELETLKKAHKSLEEDFSKVRSAAAEDKTTAQELALKASNLTKTKNILEGTQRRLEAKVAAAELETSELRKKVAALESDRSKTPKGEGGEYLRRVLLQFFDQDGDTRDKLVPVILSLVGCPAEQITRAQRRWAETNQIISHAFTFFRK